MPPPSFELTLPSPDRGGTLPLSVSLQESVVFLARFLGTPEHAFGFGILR